MKCSVIVSPAKGKVELQELELENPEIEEIQVRVQVSLVSPGTERAFILNMPNTTGVYPHEPGYCAAGVVEKVGANVTRFKPGDRVASYEIGHRSAGNVEQRWAQNVPENVSLEHAVFLSLGQTSLQAIRKTRIELGEDVLVFGLGLMGQLALQFASLSGAMTVTGVDLIEKRLQIARQCGADRTISADDKNRMTALKEKPHVIVEATGAPEVIGLACQTVRSFGRVCILSSTRGESTINFYRDVHNKGITIVGAHTTGSNPMFESRPGYWTYEDDARCFMRLLAKQRVRLDPLITERIDWTEAVEAYERILAGDPNMLGTVIRWT